MILSRNWLNEFVDLKDITDKEFNDEMTLSGSKVETIERPDENLKNVVVGKILEMKRHENSDHMWVVKIDVGQAEPVQIVTGAWNVHVGDYVPAALSGAHLPGGIKIEKGALRGVESDGMLCSLKELGMTAEHDFPYAVITPAAILNDYHPIDKDKPSIPADIKSGDKVYGPVVAAKVLECAPLGVARSTPASTSAMRPPCPIRAVRTSTRATLLPTTPRAIPSARSKICTPSRRSSPTASPTASSFCRKRTPSRVST